MGWREWADSILAQGLGTDDVDEPEFVPPSFITVCCITGYEELAIDEGDYISFHRVPIGRSRTFPMFMSKAAGRFFAYCVRKYGKGNVWDELD